MESFKNKTIIFLIFLLFASKSFAQFFSSENYEDRFDSNVYDNITFTKEYLWATNYSGLLRMNNEVTEYFCLDTNSRGSIMNYTWNDNRKNYFPYTDSQKIFNEFEILPSNTDDVWISFFSTNTIIKIKDNLVFNYKMLKNEERLISSIFRKEHSYFHTAINKLGDSSINYIYYDDGKDLKLKYYFKTIYELKENTLFLFNNNLYFSEFEADKKPGVHYLTIYRIDSSGKKSFLRLENSNFRFDEKAVKVYEDNIYIFCEKGELFKIDTNANIHFVTKILESKFLDNYNFFVIKSNLIFCSERKLKILNLCTFEQKTIDVISNEKNCTKYIEKFFLSPDNYIYCIIRTEDDNLEKFENCPWDNIRIIKNE